MRSLVAWREGELGHRTVRVSAGTWTTAFLAARIGELWQVGDPFYIEFVTAYQKVESAAATPTSGSAATGRPKRGSPEKRSAKSLMRSIRDASS